MFLKESGIVVEKWEEKAQKMSDEGKTPLFFAEEKKLIGIIAAADVVKKTSAQAVSELIKMGIDVVMVTGDNERTAKAIQKQIGIPHVIAEGQRSGSKKIAGGWKNSRYGWRRH